MRSIGDEEPGGSPFRVNRGPTGPGVDRSGTAPRWFGALRLFPAVTQ